MDSDRIRKEKVEADRALTASKAQISKLGKEIETLCNEKQSITQVIIHICDVTSRKSFAVNLIHGEIRSEHITVNSSVVLVWLVVIASKLYCLGNCDLSLFAKLSWPGNSERSLRSLSQVANCLPHTV